MAQLPNQQNMQNAITGMNASMQAYNVHQQRLTNELSLAVNFPVVQMQQQLGAIQTTIQQTSTKISAEIWNLRSQIQNGKVTSVTGALVPMRSVEAGPNPQVPVGQAIPNFPGTPDHISRMTAAQCRSFLTTLNWPLPQGQLSTTQLRATVRQAVGLTPL